MISIPLLWGLVLSYGRAAGQYKLPSRPDPSATGRTKHSGLASQFGVGLLLGAVWSSCVGPTLGAASVLAAQGRDLGHVALTMVMFAVGTALPLLLLGLLSLEALMRWHGRLASTGKVGKMALRLVLLTTGALILSGGDKSVEAALVHILPHWLTELATGF